MEASELIARAKELLAKAETTVKQFESVEPTQLRIAVHRLELFIEQHLHLAEPPAAEATDEDGGDGLDTLTRDDLNQRASQEGIDAPDKLPNKQAVIDAIREALAEDGE